MAGALNLAITTSVLTVRQLLFGDSPKLVICTYASVAEQYNFVLAEGQGCSHLFADMLQGVP